MKRSVSIIIPAYNEAQAIGRDLDGIIAAMKGTDYVWEIIVVDDGSGDGTGEIAAARGATVIRHAYNKGPGASCKTGIRQAKGEIIAMMDADNTYPGRDLPRLLEHMDSYDMVVGARKSEQGTVKFLRRPVKAFIRLLASYITSTRIPDLNSGMRVFSKELALKYFNILPASHSWVSTITLAFLSHGYGVKYVPIDYFPRTGRSSFHPILDTKNTFLLLFRTIMYFHPLKIFFPLGAFLFLGGFARTVYDARVLHRVKESDIMIIMTALIILCLGFLADLIVKMHREG